MFFNSMLKAEAEGNAMLRKCPAWSGSGGVRIGTPRGPGDDRAGKILVNGAVEGYSATMQTWLSERIVLDPAVCHGKPVVRDTRILVANVVGAVAAGEAMPEILRDYPSLTVPDIRACLEFAGRLTAMEGIEAEVVAY
jgi:uncharacterized protein (DUF433 family)